MAKRRTPNMLEANDSAVEKFHERRDAVKISKRAAAKAKDPVTKSMHEAFARDHQRESDAALSEFRNSIHRNLRNRKGTR